jgi:serine/threonine protein kinase
MDHDHEGRRYRILDVLGRGGFGTVYRAEMSSPGGFVKEVALKVVPGDLDGTTETIARLRDEARLLGALRHRSIVGVDALTRLGERWAIVMEYVQGVTIRDLLDRYGSIPLIVSLQIAIEVASALHAAWEAQVPARTLPAGVAAEPDARPTEPLRLIHRDVKPSNIQLTRNGDVKLLDFGIARSSTETVRGGNLIYGSVPYLSPERLAGKDCHEADVYALALTLVQMLVGTLPRPGAPPAERIEHARELLASIGSPPDLESIVLQALDGEAANRPDARTFGLALKRVARNFTVFEPRDWSEEHVGPLLDARRHTAGDLTGMSFADGAVTATELFMLGKAAATFDEPNEGPPPPPPPLPMHRSAIPSAIAPDATTSGLVIPELPSAESGADPTPPAGVSRALETVDLPPDEVAPPARRGGRWLVAALAGALVVGLGVVAVLVVVGAVAVVLTGALTGLLVALGR